MKQLTEDQIKRLRAPLPTEAVKPHPTKTYLSAIKAIYVIERLNEVFGIGAWKDRLEVIDNKTSMIVVKVIFEIPEYGIYLECFGGNDNGGETSKNFDLGDAYKGATTDAMTKICSFLEIGIDIYKGINAPTNGTKNGVRNETAEAKDLPWLNRETEFNGAVKKLKDGSTTIEKIKLVRRLSKAIESKLIEASQT